MLIITKLRPLAHGDLTKVAKVANMSILEHIMTIKTEVTATEFKNAAGAYIEKAAKEPVVITKHGRPARVLVDIDEYERLTTAARRAKMEKIRTKSHEHFAPLYEKLAK